MASVCRSARPDMRTSLEIAQSHELAPIEAIGERVGLRPDELEPYGRYKAKISSRVLQRLEDAPPARLVCVTGMTPTRAGEGNTTTLIGLLDGLAATGRRAIGCLREPSIGPAFGVKGGATGGGYAQAVPMEDLNLHFTGDLHAIGAANNLLAAMIDASILHGNPHQIDALQVPWRRVIDMNDRALRQVTVGLKGRANGYARETGFDITAASEVMAIMAVTRSLDELRERLTRITAAYSHDGATPVTAGDLRAAGAMTVLLKEALKPNLVQTLGGQPVLVHCGPFANIDHGNNSLIADLIADRLADYVLTECGFGSDMGMEKFCDLVCGLGNLAPAAAVLVVTARAIQHHGGLDPRSRGDRTAGLAAIELGIANVRRHLGIIARFGIPTVVAVNRRTEDSDEELELVARLARESGAFAAVVSDAFLRGGAGAAELADAVAEACELDSSFAPLYRQTQPIAEKIETIATDVYGAAGVYLYPEAEERIARFTHEGLGRLPVSIAKTHLSLSSDPSLRNAPTNFVLPVRDIRAYTGAGWLVALCGEITQMPGLGAEPAALDIDIDAEGRTVGLV